MYNNPWCKTNPNPRLMTGGIYRSEFEAINTSCGGVCHIRAMEKQGDNRRSVAQVFAGKNKLLPKCFGKTSECHVDVNVVF